MDFKRKLGHGLSALFSSDDEIDREIERMEKAQASSQMENPFAQDPEPQPFDQGISVPPVPETSIPETPFSDSSLSAPESYSSKENTPEEVGYSVNSPAYSAEYSENSAPTYEKVTYSDPERDHFSNLNVDSEQKNEETIQNRPEEPAADPAEALPELPEEETEEIQSEIRLSGDHIQLVDIYKIEPDRQQPRKTFDSAQLSELAASIKQYGVLQPLLVSREEDYYKIIAGERRYRAARMAGLEQLPVIIREFDEQDKMAVALIENIQRQELNPMEEANAYRTLMDKYRMTQEEIAEKLNKSRSSIANLLRLQRLPESVQKSLSEGLISFGHAKVLLGVEDPIEQTRLALQVVSNNLSVRDLEDLVKAGSSGSKKTGKGSKNASKVQTFSHRLAEDRLKEKLSTKVSVNSGKRKGNITIEFYSQDDLERILSILGL